ncbi:MAG TPA: lamin tail domain-containing protein [Acidimicrobiia bacterium]
MADPPPGAETATVVSITDGDTLEIRLSSGVVDDLRIIGINTPERGECFAAEAAAVLEWLTPIGSTVWLTRDVSDRDQYDRLLRDVWVGSLNVGEEMIRRGAALARDYPPDISMSERFHAAQEEAKTARLGLWAPDACGPSAGYDLVIVEIEADAPGNDHENLNGEYVVVENRGGLGVDLTGWVLKDESASHRYTFPAGFVIGAGASVTIHTGCGTDTATKLYWCNAAGAVWNNDGDTAFLLDHHGNVVDDLAWVAPTTTTSGPRPTTTQPGTGGGGSDSGCDPSYPTVCIQPYPPDLDCGDIPFRRFQVLPPDPHGFDGDNDGIGCES